MPYRGFRWVKDCENFDIFAEENPNIGYYIEADFEIPIHLHDKLSELPVLLTHEEINKQKKLVGTLTNKEKYVIHGENFKFITKLGIKATKIHRVLRFRQKKYLSPYVKLNSKLRKKATSKFEKNLRKAQNNIIFGKSVQNDRDHSNIKLVNNWKKAKHYIAKPFFKKSCVFTEDLVAIELNKTSIKLERPVYLGVSILELAKLEMFQFHYNVIQPNLNANLCYTGEKFSYHHYLCHY